MAESKRLPQLQWKTNIPQTLTFPYGDCWWNKSKTEGWGDSYRYTVEDANGNAYAWFATEYAHELIVESGLGKGGIATITKGEAPGANNKMVTRWEVDVIDPGTPVAEPVKNRPAGAAQGAQGRPTAPTGAPGTRDGAEGRLAELGAAYAACVEESKGVWARSRKGIKGDLDFETIHSTASSLFINLSREGYDLAVFANTFGETPGLQALRRLSERVMTEPHLSDVREHFEKQITDLPTDSTAQRSLYAQLLQAVRTVTQMASEGTEPDPSLDDFPEELPEGPPASKPAAEPEYITEAKAMVAKAYGDPISDEDKKKLAELLKKITRTDFATVEKLEQGQARVLIRSLSNVVARGA